MLKATVNIYFFKELNEKAQNKAICDYVEGYLEAFPESEETKAAFKEANRMRTPWFVAQIFYEQNKELVEEGCDNYYYVSNGEVFKAKDDVSLELV